MSVVEKAAEKLKALGADAPPAAAPFATAPVHAATSIERLQERAPGIERPAETAPAVSIDEEFLQRQGFSPAEDEANWRLTDQLRRAKRPLLDNATGKAAKGLAHAMRIMVTSAVPGEGKTFTALNLALSLAREPDFEVLLVDSDIPKSDVTRILGLVERPGLMDVLADEKCQPADVVVATNVPNLLVVPAGTRHPLSAELFSGRRMDHVLRALEGRGPQQRLLVFDSAPLLAASEAQVLLSHMGQVVMVVAAGHTRRHDVKLALESANASQYIGLLLNMTQPRSQNHYYGQYGQYYAGADR